MADSRYIAAEILLAVEKQGAYSSLSLNAALKKYRFPDARDKAFVTELVYGVLERKTSIDYNISLYLTKSPKKLHPAVLTLLRLGAYQLFYTDKVPAHAAVNEIVKLTGAFGQAYSRGLVNAVMRKMAGAGLTLPDESDASARYSVEMSCPKELTDFFLASYGKEKTQAILSSCLGKRPVFLRVNTLAVTAEELTEMLTAQGVDVFPTCLANCLRAENTGDITELSAYKKGLFFVEDMSSQLCCKLAGVKPGDTVVDCCAAPGGKSFGMAMYMNGNGKLYSCDMYAHKTKLIEDGAKRLGIKNIEALCRDARTLNSVIKQANVVLCDVPCSGFGVMGRKPEIKEKRLSEIAELPELQYGILSSCSEMVAPGGTLVYSTCTLNPAENEDNARKFLAGHPDFSFATDDLYLSHAENGCVTVIPSKDGGDGFFVAKFTRK